MLEWRSDDDVTPILHIISESDWRAAQAAGVWAPPSLAREGFIHCSRPEQVVATANRHFPGRTDLLLLVIDPAKVQCEIRDEDTTGRGETYPHIYGPLNLDAVMQMRPLTGSAGGGFVRPEVLVGRTLEYAGVPVETTPWWSGRMLNRIPPPILVFAGVVGMLMGISCSWVDVALADPWEGRSAVLVGMAIMILSDVCLLSALARSRGFVQVLAGLFLVPSVLIILAFVFRFPSGH